MKSRKIIIAILVGTVIIFNGLMIVSSGEKIQASSIKEFIADYGGYGIKGEWETLGTASADMIFENEKGSGWIMLGENKYLVEVLKTYIIEQEEEISIIYEGNLIGNEGTVRFALYKGVMVGEIELAEVIYSFGVAQTLESARYILDQYNEHLEEEIEPPPFEDLIVPDDKLVIPATIDIDPDTLNLKSKGEWITVYIELPKHPELPEFDVTQIDVNTVKLNDQIPAENNPKYGFVVDPKSYLMDHDDDGLLERMVKFNRTDVQNILEPGDRVKIEVTGLLFDTRPFYGLDWIRVTGEKSEKPPTSLEGYSNDFGEGTEGSEEFLAESVSKDQGFAEPELPEEASIPGKTEGVGTYFEIKNSEYFNVVLKSSEEIRVVLESIPRMISLNISSSTDATSTILTISNLEPNKTYYKYQDSYKNEAVFMSDGNGSYSWTQNLTQPHHIWFQEIKSTIFLPEDCSKYGNWDSPKRTCTLNQNLFEGVEITENSTTLNCNGHTITGPGAAGYGINLSGKIGIALNKCNITNFTYGIGLYNSNDNFLVDNNISNNYWDGIYLFASSNNLIINNNVYSNNGYGISLDSSGNNTLKDNRLSNNTYNFRSGGSSLVHYLQNIDQTNLVDGKPIYYLVSQKNVILDSTSNAGYVGAVNSKNIIIKDLNLMKNETGVLFVNTTESRIENVTVSKNAYGIDFRFSNNNVVVNNNILNNFLGMIYLYSDSNKIYHNNLIANYYNQVIVYEGAGNFFDDGYPSGGNYWSDYTGADLKNGPNQDQLGSDGIGDTPYSFTGGQDRYPFMKESGWEPVVPRERIVSVYAVADEEYIDYYDDWWNPWDQDQWRSEVERAVELGDDAFEKEFQINFVVKDIDFWDSDDSTDSLEELFNEVRREIDKGTNDIMVAFTNQDIEGNIREKLFWGPYTGGTLGLAEAVLLPSGEIVPGDDIIVVLVKNEYIDNVHQHEYSHLFGAPDHCWYLPSGEMRCDPASDPSIPCIMRYDWTKKTNSWCSGCYSTISANKWREF